MRHLGHRFLVWKIRNSIHIQALLGRRGWQLRSGNSQKAKKRFCENPEKSKKSPGILQLASDTVLHLELVGGRPRSFRGFVRDLYGIERTNQWCHLTIHEGQSAGEPKCLRRRSCGNLCCTLFKSSVMDISICVRISTRSSFVISLKAVVKCYQARVIFARKSWQKTRRPA